MRLEKVTHSSASAAAFATLLLLPGCIAQPHLGKDEGRAAIVWQHEGRGSPDAPAPAAPAEKNSERELLAELDAAERKGADELTLAATLYRLAILRRQQGEFAEAERLYRRALEIRERTQGPNHPEVAAILNNLGGVEAAQGHYGAAQPLLERALTIRQTALGSEHVLTAQSLSNLALLYAAEGNAAAAEPLYRQALSILEKTDGSQTGELERLLDNYAALLHDTGRDTEAEKLETRARAIRAAGG
jgi:tetratricopeptide (TPR) repeat protein